MNQFFNNLWNNIKDGYCRARDYLASKIARLNVYGNYQLMKGKAEDNFAKKVYGWACKAAAFTLAFMVAFATGYTLGLVLGTLLGPILGLIAIPLAYIVGEDFGHAIAVANFVIALEFSLKETFGNRAGVTANAAAEATDVGEFAAA